MTNYIHSIIPLLLIFVITTCTDNSVPNQPEDITPENDYENLIFSNKVELSNYPDFGSEFNFIIKLNDTTLKISKIKYDFDDDNKYDTTLTKNDTITKSFTNLGYNKTIASVYLDDKTVLSCSTTVWFTIPQVILSDGNVTFEPNIYNGKMLSITHGFGHQALLLDITSFTVNNIFSGFTSESFKEMHNTIPSFDGTKLLFDNGGYLEGIYYGYGYYDLLKNDSTITIVPISPPGYPVGQIIWSLDSESIFYVDGENDYGNGVKTYNIETGEHNNIYDSGEYICVVPGDNEKLAILEKIDENNSKLIIFNTETKTIENEYSNIPFHAPFRLLEDKDRVYFDGELSIYKLSTGEIYRMDFSELDLSEHMYGEADISMDGSTFIISTFHGVRALYKVILPKYF